MRVQLNQYLRDLPHELRVNQHLLSGFSIRPQEELDWIDRIEYLVNVCDFCGAEIFAEYKLPSVMTPDDNKSSTYSFQMVDGYANMDRQDMDKPSDEIKVSMTSGYQKPPIPPEEQRRRYPIVQKVMYEYHRYFMEFLKIGKTAVCPICQKKLCTPFIVFRPGRYRLKRNLEILRPEQKTDLSTELMKFGVTIEQYEGFLAENPPSRGTGDFSLLSEFTGGDDLEFDISFLHFARRCRNKPRAAERHERFIYQHDTVLPMKPKEAADGIKDSPEKLNEYIGALFELESNIYSMGNRLQTLYLDLYEAEGAVYLSDYAAERDIRNEAAEAEKICDEKIKKLIALQNTKPDTISLRKPGEPIKPHQPHYETPGLFNRRKIALQNEALKAEYDAACRKYEAELAEHRRKIEQILAEEQRLTREEKERCAQVISEAKEAESKVREELAQLELDTKMRITSVAQLPSPSKAREAILKEEIAKLEELLGRTLDCRNQLYAYNIVYGKYRNLVALATFSEYLASGRCTTLEGASGAYNVFEAECRANQIIGQLNTIITSLEQIKENQYLIYTQMRAINAGLAKMQSSMNAMNKSLASIDVNTRDMSGYMEQVARNTEVIAYNTAATAYYSKLNASLTNSLGYLIALK